MYCVYCNLDHNKDVKFSDEHIVPQSLGGPKEFQIRTCEASNNRLGNKVDQPFINLFPVNADRFFRDIKSHRGMPTLDLSGRAYVDGNEVPILYTITEGVKTFKLAKPTVTKTSGVDHDYHEISGDPEDVKRILLGKLAAAAKDHKTVTYKDGTPVTPESIDRLVQEQSVTIGNPSVLIELDLDAAVMDRFFCKVALAAAYREFKIDFGTSEIAARLRSCMEADEIEPSTLPIRYVPVDHPALKYFAVPDAHVVAFLPWEMSTLLISLFGGQYAGSVTLDDCSSTRFRSKQDGTLYRIDLSPRRLQTYSFRGYLSAKPWEETRLS